VFLHEDKSCTVAQALFLAQIAKNNQRHAAAFAGALGSPQLHDFKCSLRSTILVFLPTFCYFGGMGFLGFFFFSSLEKTFIRHTG